MPLYFRIILFIIIMPGCQSQAEHPIITAVKPGATLHKIASQALAYAASSDMQTGYCFLFDVRQPASNNRFIIYDLHADTVISKGKSAHGRCNFDWLEGRKYSNTPGSGCTSLGKYKVGSSYHGRFGLAYKLYGLDTTNNNAYNRFVVLHAHDCVPEPSSATLQLCQSDGCPMVSPGFMKILDQYLKKSHKPVLLWIYDNN